MQFEFNGKVRVGEICNINNDSSLYDKKNVYYDIMVGEEECLYKHICEKDLTKINQ